MAALPLGTASRAELDEPPISVDAEKAASCRYRDTLSE